MSLLDKIKKENLVPTVTVPPRIDTLALQQPLLDEGDKKVSEEPLLETQSASSLRDDGIASLEERLKTFPIIKDKKIGVRLEEKLYEEIRSFCNQEGITVETLLEAYFTICKTNSEITNKVIEEARSRIKLRTEAGNIRSLLTKTRNLKG